MEKSNKSFGLGLIGFTAQQKETFEAILSLAERRLENVWKIVELVQADFFLVSTEKSQSESIIIESKLPLERCLFCSGQEVRSNNEIQTDVRNIPRLGSLVDMLNQLSNSLALSENSVFLNSVKDVEDAESTGDDTVTFSHDVVFFDPEQCFLKYLLRDSSDLFLCRFNSPTSSHELYINMSGKVYFCQSSLKDLGACLEHEKAIIIQTMSHTVWSNTIQDTTLPARPLNNLIWYLAFKLSNGRLLRGHLAEEIVYLTRWPDLGVQDCGQYVKLAAFMHNNALCLMEVAEKTATPLAEVYDFYNACFLIGIVEKTDKSEVRKKNLDDDRQQLLTKIANRLKRLNSQAGQFG